jgi:transposase
VLREDVELLWQGYDAAAALEEQARRRLVQLARQDEVVRRFEALPGVGWVRAATLVAFLDTPWRFASKQALWRYLGVGLERRRSGNGPERLRVPRRMNRLLKSAILGAARSAVLQGENPFAEQYRRWVGNGLSPRLARRNVARSLAAVLWGMWKSGNVYHPEWVGRAVTLA